MRSEEEASSASHHSNRNTGAAACSSDFSIKGGAAERGISRSGRRRYAVLSHTESSARRAGSGSVDRLDAG